MPNHNKFYTKLLYKIRTVIWYNYLEFYHLDTFVFALQVRIPITKARIFNLLGSMYNTCLAVNPSATGLSLS